MRTKLQANAKVIYMINRYVVLLLFVAKAGAEGFESNSTSIAHDTAELFSQRRRLIECSLDEVLECRDRECERASIIGCKLVTCSELLSCQYATIEDSFASCSVGLSCFGAKFYRSTVNCGDTNACSSASFTASAVSCGSDGRYGCQSTDSDECSCYDCEQQSSQEVLAFCANELVAGSGISCEELGNPVCKGAPGSNSSPTASSQGSTPRPASSPTPAPPTSRSSTSTLAPPTSKSPTSTLAPPTSRSPTSTLAPPTSSPSTLSNQFIPSIDHLGLGFDIATGKTKQRVFNLANDEPKSFQHSLMGELLIPMNVECLDITRRNEHISTKKFESIEEFQSDLAAKVGAGFLGKYAFRASVEYQRARDEVFAQNKFTMEAAYDQPLYSCRLDTENQELDASAQSIVDSGSSVVEKLGTHVINVVVVGGHVQLTTRLDSCILQYVQQDTITSQFRALFWKIPLYIKVDESYDSVGSCKITYTFFELSKSAIGGNLALVDESQDAWYESIQSQPQMIRHEIMEIERLVSGIDSTVIQDYLDTFDTDDSVIISEEFPCVCASGTTVISIGILEIASFSILSVYMLIPEII